MRRLIAKIVEGIVGELDYDIWKCIYMQPNIDGLDEEDQRDRQDGLINSAMTKLEAVLMPREAYVIFNTKTKLYYQRGTAYGKWVPLASATIWTNKNGPSGVLGRLRRKGKGLKYVKLITLSLIKTDERPLDKTD